MNHLLQQLAGSGWTHVVNALLHTLWQGAILAAVLGITLRRLTSPAHRYRCGLAALVAIFASGLITWAVLNSSDSKPTATAVGNSLILKPMEVGQLGEPETVVVVRGTKGETPKPPRWTAWLALIWLAGAGVMLARAGAQVAGAGRLRRSCRPLEDSQVAALAAEAQRAVKLTRQVRIAVTDKLTSPAVVGVLVPTLILPLSLVTTLTPEQIRFILLHELAHIRRGDYLANLFQLFAEALLFFNPAVWWISHQIRREREACCDALAIELSGAPADYARTLVHVAESILTPPPVAAPAFGEKHEPSSLTDRIQRLLVPGYRPALRLTWRAMLTALLLGSALLVLSAMGTRVTVVQIISAPKPAAKQSDSAANNIGSTNRPPVEISAGESLFDLDRGIGTYSNNVVMKGSNFVIRADSATVNKNTGELNANGHVVYKRGDQVSNASSIRYNIRTGEAIWTASEARRALMAKLDKIQLPSVSFDAQPLGEVVRQLSQQIRLSDPQTNGINFLMNPTSNTSITPSSPRIDPATGLPVSNTVAQAFAPESVLITIRPPLTNARLADVLEAVVKGANKPIKYSILDYGIAFSPKGPETPALHIRTFRVDMENFASTIGATGVTNVSRLQEKALSFLTKAGVDLTPQTGKNIFVNTAKSEIMIRATAAELDKIEKILFERNSEATRNSGTNASNAQEFPSTRDQAEALQLHIRTFRVDTGKFISALGMTGVRNVSRLQAAVLTFFSKAGVDLSPTNGKNVFFNDRRGDLLIRATTEELDKIEKLLTELNSGATQSSGTNASAPANLKLQVPKVVFPPLTFTSLYTRTFHVDFPTLLFNLRERTGVGLASTPVEKHDAVLKLFSDFGVELNPAMGKTVFLNDARGELLVRATKDNLDAIEALLQSVAVAPPQLNIKVKFVSVPAKGFEGFLSSLGITNRMGNSPMQQVTGILTPAQFRSALSTMEQNPETAFLTVGEVTTLSGQQCQIQTVDTKTFVTGMTNGVPKTETIPMGPAVDFIPYVNADGYTIQLRVIPTVAEFLGYDDPGTFVVQNQGTNQPPEKVIPLPRFRVRQMKADAIVWDGQTLVLAGAPASDVRLVKDKVTLLGDIPFLGKMFRSENTTTQTNQLIVFVTPTIINSVGNRVHPDDLK